MSLDKRSNYRHFFAFAIAIIFIFATSYLIYCELQISYLNNILATSQLSDNVVYIEEAIKNINQNKTYIPIYTIPMLGILVSALIRLS